MTGFEKIREGLEELKENLESLYVFDGSIDIQKPRLKEHIAFLHSLLAAINKPGEDVELIREVLTAQRMKAEFIGYEGSQKQMEIAIAALDRLALVAGVGEKGFEKECFKKTLRLVLMRLALWRIKNIESSVPHLFTFDQAEKEIELMAQEVGVELQQAELREGK